jgi:hypothetical protein
MKTSHHGDTETQRTARELQVFLMIFSVSLCLRVELFGLKEFRKSS